MFYDAYYDFGIIGTASYDLDRIAGKEIVVRRAENDEKFVTLDGQERTMDDQVLMICDGEKAVGIAGIIDIDHISMKPFLTPVDHFLHSIF